MYQFAVVVFLGLAVLKVVDLIEDLVPGLARFRAVATFAVAVAGVVALDYSVFEGFGITLRDATIGTWITGVVVGGMASAWQAALGWLGSTERVAPASGRSDRPRIAA